jgi:hypothetical protein
MPTDKADEADWFREFQRVNQEKGDKAGKASPSSGDASPPEPSGSNRRGHARFEVDDARCSLYREGLLSFIGVGGKENMARTALDVSEGGVRLLVHERIAPGTKVRIKIRVEKYDDEIEAPGIVRWCYQCGRNRNDYFAGVQFLDLDSAQAKKLTVMKKWFTSAEYQAVRASRQRTARPASDGLIGPK